MFEVNHPDELKAVAQAILDTVKRPAVVALTGDLGAGKTALVKAFCHLLGVQDAVCSPSFSLVNEYHYLDANGIHRPVYHIDLYRLKNLEEVLDIGLPEYLDSGEWCFIEWPEIAESLLPSDVIALQLTIQPDGRRKILFL